MKFEKSGNIFIKGAILLTIFVLIASSFLFMPQKAHAQFVVHDPLKFLKDGWDLIWKHGGSLAYRNGLNFFLGQAAKQSAEYLAGGMKGKKPAFLTDSGYWKKLGDQALGDFIATAGESLTGLDLCELDPQIKFDVLLTLDKASMTWKPENKCSFTDLKNNLDKAMKGNLIDFSFDIEEGDLKRQKGAISSLIQGDPILTDDLKLRLDGKLQLCTMVAMKCEPPEGGIELEINNVFYYYAAGEQGIGAYLHQYTKDIEIALGELQDFATEIEDKSKEVGVQDLAASGIFEESASIKFRELGIKLTQETGTELWGNNTDMLKLHFFDEYSAACSKKSWEDVCVGVYAAECANLCSPTINCQNSADSYKKECLEKIKQTNKYVKKLVSWATKLQDMVDKIIDNWEKRKNIPNLGPLEDAQNMFNPESNPMAIQMELKNKALDKVTGLVDESKFFKTLEGIMKSSKSLISGAVRTPSTLVSEKARKAVKDGDASLTTTTNVAVVDALSIFANTFLMKFVQEQFFNKGLNKDTDPGSNVVSTDPDEMSRAEMEIDIKVVPINLSSDEMTIYDEIAICPTGINRNYASTFNCLLDNNLTRAVEERMTIQEAMDAGLLNPNERIGASLRLGLLSDVNIKKLRRMGIMPLGMEIAAKKIREEDQTPNGRALSQVVADFNQRGNDEICGNSSDPSESEYCNLVDPNWVLKASTYLCDLSGYSAVPIKDSAFRQDACIDIKTCINETEDRQCKTWSYCTREKNVWRFGGDGCDEQYNTCRAYTSKSDNKISSYLSNTLDYENCNSSNVGCKWYCSKWDQTYSGASGNWSCLSPGWRQYTCYIEDPCDVVGGCDCTCNGDNGCPDGLGNCTVTEGGISCSLDRPDFRNVAFFSSHIGECKEADEGCDQYIRTKSGLGVNFLTNGSFEQNVNEDEILDGWEVDDTTVIQIVSPKHAQNGSNVVQVQTIDLFTSGDKDLVQEIYNIPNNGDFILSGYYKRNNHDGGTANLKLKICYDDGCGDSEELGQSIDLDKTGWQYVSLSFSSNHEKFINHLEIFAFDADGFIGDVYVDSLQVRNELGPSGYRDYGTKGIIYLKSAPEWMNCYDGDENNNNEACHDFIQECEQTNVGCELYSPVESISYPVPAIINDRDACDSACIGYQTFEEMPTNFINDQQWVNLIPSTAKKCSAPGCEQFTNIDAVSIGGEGKEYYTYLRQCVKTNTQGLAIVDSGGNAISPASADTCQYYYTWVGEETNGYQLKKYYLESDSSLGGPVQVSLVPNPEWDLCDEYNLDNPHCRQFYDAMGNVYYRLYKNTRTCSQDCSPYRRAVDDMTHMAIETEGEVCGAQDIGCREYKGSAYGNMRNLFSDRFLSSADPWENVEISHESINRLGQSIKADANLAQRPVNDLVQEGKVYSLSLWVKGSGSYIASFGNDIYFITGEPHSVSVISNEWQEIKFGSIYFNRQPEIDEKLIIQGPNNFYLDNIILNEVQDDVYLIKDSWNTPGICDTDLEGNILHGYALGCQAYWDRSNSAHYFKSFSRLCSEKVVGCEAIIDTQNSLSPFREEFNNGSPQGDEIVIPADTMVYRVNDIEKTCAMENKGCQKFGLPELDSDDKAIDFTDVYLLNNPDLYNSQSVLCDILGEGCQEYENNGGQVWFKDPVDNVCEYRKNVMIGGQHKDGWFEKETSIPCYVENWVAYQPYGSVYGIRPNTDLLYDGTVGICPENQDGCSQFINPVEQNLILNSGFELDKDQNGIPDNWVPYAEPTQFSLESVDCLSGNCWRVNHAVSGTSAGTQYIAVQPGSVYELSAWMKASGTGTSRIYLKFYDTNDTFMDGDFSEQSGFTDGKWAKHTVILEAPYNAAYAKVEAPYVDGLMDVRIDNISLRELGANTGSYYYLNNDNLDRASCEGMVGVKDGCVLFNDVSSANNSSYDSASTYAKSQSQGDISVNVMNINTTLGANGDEGDSNVILKVKRDRVCGEWLHCSGFRMIWDSSIDDYRNICDSWVRCDKLIGSGKQAQCGHVVYEPNPSVLSEAVYRGRDVSWSGMDYSGYSILNMYPVERLFPSDENIPGDYVLTYTERTCVAGINQGNGCRIDNDCPGSVCSEGSEEKGVDGLGSKIAKIAYIYPERSSPFKTSAGAYYNKVNLCNSCSVDEACDYPGDNTGSLYPDCQGSYLSVEYGDQYSGLTKYYNFDAEDISVRKACKSSGENCSPAPNGPGDAICKDPAGQDVIGNECIFPNKTTQVMGTRAFCLEPDESKPEDANACITWWPGASAGDVDVYSMHYSAGHRPAPNRSWYCASDDSDPIFGVDDPDNYAFENVTDETNKCWDGHNGCKNVVEYLVNIPAFIHEDDIAYITMKLAANDVGEDCDGRYSGWTNKRVYLQKIAGDATPETYGDSYVYHEGNWYGCVTDDGDYGDSCHDNAQNTDPLTCRCQQDGGSSGCACTKIQAGFDANGFLSKIRVRAIDYSPDEGSSDWHQGAKVYLKSGCQYLVNAVPSNNLGLAVGYTDNLWSGSAYYGTSPGTGDQVCVPYGVSNITTPNKLTITGSTDSTETCEGGTIEGGKANIVYNPHTPNGLRGLFAKVDETQIFNLSNMQYADNSANLYWDETSSADVKYAPVIATDFDNENKIQIGENSSGNVGPTTSPYIVNLKFYAWADTNHMPIREVSIDWLGDNSDPIMVQFYNVISKNHRPECDDSEFGSTSLACTDKYFLFNHNYSCEGPGSIGWEAYPGCSGMCCFKPKVYIKDNWGWCAGNPPVYVGWDPDDGSANNCKDWADIVPAVNEPGISYDGIIKVEPTH